MSLFPNRQAPAAGGAVTANKVVKLIDGRDNHQDRGQLHTSQDVAMPYDSIGPVNNILPTSKCALKFVKRLFFNAFK